MRHSFLYCMKTTPPKKCRTHHLPSVIGSACWGRAVVRKGSFPFPAVVRRTLRKHSHTFLCE